MLLPSSTMKRPHCRPSRPSDLGNSLHLLSQSCFLVCCFLPTEAFKSRFLPSWSSFSIFRFQSAFAGLLSLWSASWSSTLAQLACSATIWMWYVLCSVLLASSGFYPLCSCSYAGDKIGMPMTITADDRFSLVLRHQGDLYVLCDPVVLRQVPTEAPLSVSYFVALSSPVTDGLSISYFCEYTMLEDTDSCICRLSSYLLCQWFQIMILEEVWTWSCSSNVLFPSENGWSKYFVTAVLNVVLSVRGSQFAYCAWFTRCLCNQSSDLKSDFVHIWMTESRKTSSFSRSYSVAVFRRTILSLIT